MCCHFYHGIKADFSFQSKSALAHLNWLQHDVKNMSNRCVFLRITKYHRALTSGSNATTARCKCRVDFQAHSQANKTLNLHCSLGSIKLFWPVTGFKSQNVLDLMQFLRVVKKWAPGRFIYTVEMSLPTCWLLLLTDWRKRTLVQWSLKTSILCSGWRRVHTDLMDRKLL